MRGILLPTTRIVGQTSSRLITPARTALTITALRRVTQRFVSGGGRSTSRYSALARWPLVSQFEGTLDQFSGDGIMVFFNDPVPIPNPAERAVMMAMAMREEAGKLIATWRRDGCELGFGAGIAQGYATLGQIGFSERSGYTAIGTVCNLAARLCAEAKDGQILISSRVARAVEAGGRLEDLGNLELKRLRRPGAAFNVVQSTSPAEAPPNLTVVPEGTGGLIPNVKGAVSPRD